MKLAFVSPPGINVLPPYQKSAGIWTYEVARRLATDHEVHVYSSSDPRQEERKEKEGVFYHFIDMSVDRPLLFLLSRLKGLRKPQHPLFATPLYHLGYATKIGLDLRRREIEFCHINSSFQMPPVFMNLSPLTEVALHMRCEWLTQFEKSKIRPLIRDVDLLLGCSNYVTESIRRGFPELSLRCHTIYPGVDTETFKPAGADSDNRLLFIGRVSPEKGIHTLLEAFEIISVEHPGVSLEVVGSQVSAPPEFILKPSKDPLVRDLSRFYGPTNDHYYQLLREKISCSGLEDRVTFTSFLPHNKIPEVMFKSTLLINPSLYESFGRSLIEAMACGRPVVATRTGGMTETVQEGRTGFLVERENPRELAVAISTLLDEPIRARKMGAAGRKRISRLFSWKSVVESLLTLYSKA